MSGHQRASYASAYDAMGAVQKSGPGVPVYTRYVNRRLGRHLAALSAAAGLTPNTVTLASGALSVVALLAVAVVEPSLLLGVVVTVVLAVAYALDSADGQLARFLGAGGPSGEWLDHVVDAGRHLVLHLAVLVSLYRFTDLADDRPALLLLPMLFAVAVSVRFFGQILGEQLRRADAASRSSRQGGGNGGTGGGGGGGGKPAGGTVDAQHARSWLQLPSDTGIQNLMFLVLPFTGVFLVVYAVLLVLNAGLGATSLVRRFRELSALGRERVGV